VERRQRIIVNTTAWLKDQHRKDHPNDSPKIKQLASDQSKIGWDHFIRGRLALLWGRNINDHLQQNRIINITAEQWGADFICINWRFFNLLWHQ
jgi:hypothetical protein